MKVGQPLRTAEEVHKLAELHGGKAGTPTMGGIMILGTTMVAILICGRILNPFCASGSSRDSCVGGSGLP
jgi:phospho-N-acetylmuramoyl-pentapeptide-transferase